MDFDELRYFMAVAKCRNFTKAAEELYIAQPSLSKKISKLEQMLDCKLFERTKRRVELTPAGHILFAEGDELLQHVDYVIEKVLRVKDEHSGHLCAAFLGAVDVNFLPMIETFKKCHTDVRLDLVSTGLRQTYQLLEQGTADIIITLDFGVFTIPDIKVKNIYSESVSLAMPKDHWFIKSKRKDFSLLKDENFIFFSAQESPHSYEQSERICAAWGFAPKHKRQGQSLDSVLFSIGAGDAIAILPDHARRYANDSVHFMSLPNEKDSIKIIAAWKKNNYNPMIALFLNELIGFKKRI